MGMVYGKAAFNAFLEMLPIGILLSSKEKGSFSERSFPQNILFCTIAFAETKSSTASREQKLSLAELRSATSCFETVFFTLFHTRITSEEARFFQNRTVSLFVNLQKRSGQTVTDSTSLTRNTAAGNIALNIKTAHGIGQLHRLTDDQLQGLQAKVIIDIPVSYTHLDVYKRQA